MSTVARSNSQSVPPGATPAAGKNQLDLRVQTHLNVLQKVPLVATREQWQVYAANVARMLPDVAGASREQALQFLRALEQVSDQVMRTSRGDAHEPEAQKIRALCDRLEETLMPGNRAIGDYLTLYNQLYTNRSALEYDNGYGTTYASRYTPDEIGELTAALEQTLPKVEKAWPENLGALIRAVRELAEFDERSMPREYTPALHDFRRVADRLRACAGRAWDDAVRGGPRARMSCL